MSNDDLLKRRLEREILARKEAEKLLESKSLELFKANEQLRELNADLEQQVDSRTKELTKSETRYRNLIEGANEIIFVTRTDGTIGFVNHITTEKLGLPKSKIIGKHYTEFISDEYKEATIRKLSKAVRSQEPNVYIEFISTNLGAKPIWLGQNIQFTYGEDGRMLEALNIARDITDQKEAENVLLTQELQLRTLVDNLHSGILFQSKKKEVLQMNSFVCDFFHLSKQPADLIGKPVKEVFNLIANQFEDSDSLLEKLSKTEEKIVGEEHRLKDKRCIQFDFIPIYSNDVLIGTLWQFLDITAKKLSENNIRNSEEKYRSLLENMELGLLEVDNDGYITRAYDGFCRMTGYTKEELIGKRGEDFLLAPEYLPVINAEHDRRAEGEQSVFEVELFKKNGDRMWTIISGAPFYDLKGERQGSVGVHFDITPQKRLQAELLKAIDVAEQAQRAEQHFLASMSHEIRTPLNAVIGMSHLLYDTHPTAEQKEYLEMIQYSANLLNNLVTDILDFSKIKSGQLELNETEFDLVAMLNTLHKTFELKSANKPIKIVSEIPQLDHLVYGDETMVNQILYNLLGNAEKFTSEGEISLKTEIESNHDGSCQVLFTIADTGIGISESKLNNIFEEFRQESRDTQTRFGGTGLGLSITKKIVEFLGGEITVKSVKNVGSTFYVRIPLQLTDQKIQSINIDSTSFNSNKTVLFVEDTLINQNYIRKILKNESLDYDIANNGFEGLKMCEKKKYDLIFMDISMPRMDGYETTIKLRKGESLNKETPIIALTASAVATKKNKAYELGMNDYMTKPFTPSELKRKLVEFLGEAENQPVPEERIARKSEKLTGLLDRETMRMFYDDNEQSQFDMFELFLDQFEKLHSTLNQFIISKDFKEAQKIAHRLKPTFTMVGVPSLQTAFQQLEDSLRLKDEKATNHQWSSIVEMFDLYIPEVKLEYNRLKAKLVTE